MQRKQRSASAIAELGHVLRRVRIHPGYFVIPTICSIGSAALEGASVGLLIPLLQGFLERDYTFIKETPVLGDLLSLLPPQYLGTDRSLFVVLIGVYVIAVFLKNILRLGMDVSLAFIVQRTLHHLRKVLFSRYLRFGKAFFDRIPVGHHATVFVEFTEKALTPLLSLSTTVNAFFCLIAYVVVMAFISWEITFFAVPALGLLYLASQVIIKRIGRISQAMANESRSLGKQVTEILSVIPLVKASNTEFFEQHRYTEISDTQARLGFRIRVLQYVIRPLQEITVLLLALLLFSALLMLLVFDDAGRAPAFLVYFYVVLKTTNHMTALMNFRGQLADSTGSRHAVLDALSDDGKGYVPDGSSTFSGIKKAIEFRGLSFSYADGTRALDDVAFTVEQGKMTAIVGPTGSGKTTVINLLLRFYDAPPNTILMDGTDIREFSAHSLRDRMALVSQDVLLLHDTLRHNITYGLSNVPEERVFDAVRRARLDVLVARLPKGLETVIGDRGITLSGGEKQRTAIARALLKDADILILDEATSALDSRTETLIKEAIDEAVSGRTTLVIAHRLSTIQHADSIVVLQDGRCVEQGAFKELVERGGVFAALWEAQRFV